MLAAVVVLLIEMGFVACLIKLYVFLNRRREVIFLCGVSLSHLKELEGKGVYGALQKEVDKTLALLATNFHKACEKEEEAKAAFNQGPSEEGFDFLKEEGKNVRFHKKAFWKYYGLAKKIGFNVHARHADYLPSHMMSF